MKNIIVIALIAITSIGCSKSNDDPKNNIPAKLIGKWLVIELYSTDGGSEPTWVAYDSGKIYDSWFKNDGTYINTGTTNTDCMSGNFSISGNYITYRNSPCASEEPVIIESLTETELVLDGNCIEPCKSRFIKVTE